MLALIQNGLVLKAGRLQRLDIALANGQITALAPHLPAENVAAADCFDATGLVITPGLVDGHVHFRDPGFTAKETLTTGGLAAAHGGFTSVCAMPNLNPVPDNVADFTELVHRNQVETAIHTYQFAPITTELIDNQLVDFEGLAAAGAVGFTNDGHGVQTAQTMYLAMQAAAAMKLPIVAHVEDESLVNGGFINEGPAAARLNLPGIPGVSESAQVARDLELARASGVHYHICHISTTESVNLVRQAKASGVNVTCEVTPHHLLLDDSAIQTDDAMLKMNPPLRSLADRQSLWAGLMDGTIDMIATDHAPHTDAEKHQSIAKAPFGIVGSETAFELLYTHLVVNGPFTLAQLINWLSIKPAQIFHLQQAGQLAVGQVADLAIFDLHQYHQIQVSDFKSLGHNTPFSGENVTGLTRLTLVAGQIAYQGGDAQ